MFEDSSSLTTIYVSDRFVTSSVITNNYYPENTFLGCTSLVGGNGTHYDSNHVDHTYARIDAPGTPGYFTAR